jgi:hypothetical protein
MLSDVLIKAKGDDVDLAGKENKQEDTLLGNFKSRNWKRD